jgi:SAM-dependent methyltransferase
VPRDWDHYYSNPANFSVDPAPLLVQVAEMLPPGQALDLACGPGRNALYLARLGWRVTAVDASEVAIAHLRRRSSEVDARVADLERGEWAIAPAAYDLICDFYYLQRDLFPRIRDGVRPGGVFTGAVHLIEPGRDPQFSLEPGELRSEFATWKILYYLEGAESRGQRRSARIIARRA